jgi:hypothetical protein
MAPENLARCYYDLDSVTDARPPKRAAAMDEDTTAAAEMEPKPRVAKSRSSQVGGHDTSSQPTPRKTFAAAPVDGREPFDAGDRWRATATPKKDGGAPSPPGVSVGSEGPQRPERRVPERWLQGGLGWDTGFFSDLESFNAERQQPGVHRCEVPLPDGRPCAFVVSGGEWRFLGRWYPQAQAPAAMAEHLLDVHPQIAQYVPRKRGWATTVDNENPTHGTAEGCFCGPCQLVRQRAALYGYPQAKAGCCACCSATGCPCCTAYSHRRIVVGLHNVDEGAFVSCVQAFFCFPCTVAKVYRELSAVDMWPGASCDATPPAGLQLGYEMPNQAKEKQKK